MAITLHEFASTTDASGEKVVQVRFSIADQPDQAKRTEWIDAQLSIDAPTVRNGALLRALALRKASDELLRLSGHFEQIGRAP